MAAVVELLLQHNRNDTQQKHQKKESKREVATTTATSMLTMRDKDGIVEVMSSPHEGCPQHQVQELGPLSPTVQQQPQEKERQEKEWRQHEQLKDQEKPISLAPLDGSAFVSEGVWTKIKKSNDDTEDVEAQRSRLNAIRNSWCEQFQAPGDPVLVVATSSFPSSPSPPSSPSNKQVRRTHTAHNVTNTNGNTGTNSYGNNNTVHNNISKSPSQNTNATATTIFTGTTPTSSYRRGSLGYSSVHQQQFNNNHNNNINGGGSAVLDQETISTWRGLLASVRQLSHDTSTTGSSTHYSSASSTSLSSSAQSINNINSCNEREQVWKSKGHNARHSKYRNSDDASTIRATESFFNRRLSSSSQQQLKGIATHAFSGLAATSSSSTIDLEKRVMMTARNPPKKLTILVLGDGAVGKSALTLRFLRDQFTDEYDPTIEDSYCKYIEVDGQDYTLELTDTAGQSEYRDQWDDQFMRTGDGFICVYSIASMSSFGELVGFRDQIWRAKGSRRVPIVITGNKCDLQEGEREVRMDVGALFAERSNALFVETRQRKDRSEYSRNVYGASTRDRACSIKSWP
ncbi:hypothetical protein EC991_006582 [Linnemannia zychae]|nr:hypothetical protein EC991_006582 [Linnemannia zychae]